MIFSICRFVFVLVVVFVVVTGGPSRLRLVLQAVPVGRIASWCGYSAVFVAL